MQHIFIHGSHPQEGKTLLASHLVAELPQHAMVRITSANSTPETFDSIIEYIQQRHELALQGTYSTGGYLVIDCESGASAQFVAHLVAVTGYDHERAPWMKTTMGVCFAPTGHDVPYDFVHTNSVFAPKTQGRCLNLSSRHPTGFSTHNYANMHIHPFLSEEPTWNEVAARQILIGDLAAECNQRECLTDKALNEAHLWGLGNRSRRIMAMDSEMKAMVAIIKTAMVRNALSV